MNFTAIYAPSSTPPLSEEWLETNGRGDYASSTFCLCNTRKYHGLLVADVPEAGGRHVLLSTLEESLLLAGQEHFISTRKHPEAFYPQGYETLRKAGASPFPWFCHEVEGLLLTRELLLVRGERLLIVRYRLDGLSHLPGNPEKKGERPVVLCIKPLLAFRGFHRLTHTNDTLDASFTGECGPAAVAYGSIRPYTGLPALYMYATPAGSFEASADWYHRVEYPVEEDRGFPGLEDLFKPGQFLIPLRPGRFVYLAFSANAVAPAQEEGGLERLWKKEERRRLAEIEDVGACFTQEESDSGKESATALRDIPRRPRAGKGATGLFTASKDQKGGLRAHLAREGGRFFTKQGENARLLAGYHWFDAWGRDTMIALPGLAFCGGRPEDGAVFLYEAGEQAKNGLVPNCYGADGVSHAYNSIDASLWYVWAVQQMALHRPDTLPEIGKRCRPVIKAIIRAYSEGGVPHARLDREGFLHVGTEHTQLTWMDAMADGRPVTPRNGCPVEINALWYNALAFSDELARTFRDTRNRQPADKLFAMRSEFRRRFWVEDEKGPYLADVWREDGADRSLRPNQLFAVSLPHAILGAADGRFVVERVKQSLLTPYGLRTLAPEDPRYQGRYQGGPSQRDGAYHQGTVWPWLLGAYAEAALKTGADPVGTVRTTLGFLRPLFAAHLGQAGVGSISEIFSGDDPHRPDGCIAQAWSVGEVLRMLCMFEQTASQTYREWEETLYMEKD